jgi:hypothetical protein
MKPRTVECAAESESESESDTQNMNGRTMAEPMLTAAEGLDCAVAAAVGTWNTLNDFALCFHRPGNKRAQTELPAVAHLRAFVGGGGARRAGGRGAI